MAKNDFDRILRENAERILQRHVRKIMGFELSESEPISESFTGTFENKVDFLYRAKDNEGQEILIHFEYQTTDDPKMVYRMQRYHGIINFVYPYPIHHFVVYLGNNDSKMEESLPESEVFSSFRLGVNIVHRQPLQCLTCLLLPKTAASLSSFWRRCRAPYTLNPPEMRLHTPKHQMLLLASEVYRGSKRRRSS